MAYPGLQILHDATSGVMAFWKKKLSSGTSGHELLVMTLSFELTLDCEIGNSCCLCIVKWKRVELYLQFVLFLQRK